MCAVKGSGEGPIANVFVYLYTYLARGTEKYCIWDGTVKSFVGSPSQFTLKNVIQTL